tara:strand:- start:578 stop:1882 length:1305 start_codon:yes stop_codon:yes gene_type:complete
LPFWLKSNKNGINYKNSKLYFYTDNHKSIRDYNIKYGLKFNLPYSNSIESSIEQGFVKVSNNTYYLSFGRLNQNLSNESRSLSSGSLIMSNNTIPIPMINIGIIDYIPLTLLQFDFQLKGGFSHGWLDKGQYLKSPFLHQKNLYLNKIINSKQSLTFGIVHVAIWGGATRIHGNQPQKMSDYLRIFFLQPGSDKEIKQERINTLGNHLGIWDIAYNKEINQKKFKFYYQHPFEDESGARWLSNRFDGLYGIEIQSNRAILIKNILYEYINTMNQSGPEGASDSTYGWDNYYNHYIYQSGWTYNKKVIGNPLFTLGSNKGSYSNGTYIVNNRIKAHHIGIMGNVSKKINYKMLFTFSQNYGIFPDEAKLKKENKSYRYENGLIQRSGLVQIGFNNFFKQLNAQVSYGIDQGKLLAPSKALLFSISYNYSSVSASK